MEKQREEENLEKKKNIQDSSDVNSEKKFEKPMEELLPTTRSPPWEDLPYHLLELFLKPISPPFDRPNLSRVCKAWGEFKSPCFPAVVHRCTSIYSFMRGIDDEYPIKSCLGSSHGWLIIRMEKKWDQYPYHRNEVYYVLNVFTKEIIQLPILWNVIPACPKICLSSEPTDPDCIALLFDDVFRGFVFSKRGCNKWIECKYHFNKLAQDDEYYVRHSVIPHGGKFYAVGYQGNLVVIDVNHHNHHHHPTTATATAKTLLTVLPVNGLFPTKPITLDWVLIESLGKLVVVSLYRNQRDEDITNLGVFELDFETMSWITMKNLPGDQVLFIGWRSSFSISGSEIGISSSSCSSSNSGRGGYNCIYVSDNGKVHRYDMHNQEWMVCTGFPDSKAFDRYDMMWVKPSSV